MLTTMSRMVCCQWSHYGPSNARELTYALQSVPEGNIDVCCNATHNSLAIGSQAACQHADLGFIEEGNFLPNDGTEQLGPAQQADEVLGGACGSAIVWLRLRPAVLHAKERGKRHT